METQPIPQNFDPMMDLLFEVTRDLPELRIVNDELDLDKGHPRMVEKILESYSELFDRMANLIPADLDIIKRANLAATDRGIPGPSTLVTADRLVRSFGDNPHDISDIANDALHTGTATANAARVSLRRKFEAGSAKKISAPQFRDGDPLLNGALVGHIDVYGTTELFNYVIANYLDEYFSMTLKDRGDDLVVKPGFLMSAMKDVLLLDHAQAKEKFTDIYSAWVTPRERGGLGLIDTSNEAIYVSAIRDAALHTESE